MQKIFISVLLLLVMAAACDKKNDKPSFSSTFPQSYEAYEMRAGRVRLFSSKGEITNQYTIAAYIQEHGTGSRLYFGNTRPTLFPFGITKLDAARVWFFTGYDNGAATCILWKEAGDDIFLTPVDTLRSDYLYYDPERPNYPIRVKKGLSTYQPLYEVYDLYSNPPHRYRPLYYAKRVKEELEFPYINGFVYQGANAVSPIAIQFFNKLDPKGYTTLESADTLVVQENTVVMRKLPQ
jgi:hypothetical protein